MVGGPSFDRDLLADRVRFVLVEPRSGGNVGAAARALKNLGFRRLRVVAPACDPAGDEARRMAMDAVDVLEAARVGRDLDAGLEGARTVIGTTRRTGKHRKPHWPLHELVPRIVELASAGEVAFVFGREDHGLSDAALDRCTHIVQLLAFGEYPSFNLAQSVLLVAYELRRGSARVEPADASLAPPADHAAREGMYAHLRAALWAIGFLHRDSDEPMMRRIRRMLGRANMTDEEVQILRGVARQTLWLAREAGLETPHDPEP